MDFITSFLLKPRMFHPISCWENSGFPSSSKGTRLPRWSNSSLTLQKLWAVARIRKIPTNKVNWQMIYETWCVANWRARFLCNSASILSELCQLLLLRFTSVSQKPHVVNDLNSSLCCSYTNTMDEWVEKRLLAFQSKIRQGVLVIQENSHVENLNFPEADFI